MKTKSIKFYTLGCKVNQYDTQNIREQFERVGFKELENSYPADIYVINTCTVTHRADSESLNLIRRAQRENPKARIMVTGCLAELDRDRISQINKKIIIVTNKEKENIVEKVIARHKVPKQSQNKRLLRSFYSLAMTKNTGISYFKAHTRAFLKIQDGCNNVCSYCKVPLVRGSSRSRRLSEISAEAQRLVTNGFKEIVLTGICLGAYGRDLKPSRDLIDVINALENIDGLLRIRLSSIEAGDVSDSLIQKMSQSKKLCRHLHIPIQSGDDEILKKMHRKYCRDDYINLIKKIKSQIPKIAITTDVLIGFPGENESNFNHTLKLVKEIRPLKVHIFPYSRREGTSAVDNFNRELNPVIIKERVARLKKIADTLTFNYKKEFLNRKMNVLIEERLRKENSYFWQGYTDNYINVLIKSKRNLKNELISMKSKKIYKDYILADFG